MSWNLLEFLRSWRLRLLAVAALFGGPGFFFVQSFVESDSALPNEPFYSEAERQLNERAGWGDTALNRNSALTAQLATDFIRQGEFAAAEAWLLYGAAELRSPAIMMLYGDFLRQSGERPGRIRALAWYQRAQSTLGQDLQPEQQHFRQALAGKLAEVTEELR